MTQATTVFSQTFLDESIALIQKLDVCGDRERRRRARPRCAQAEGACSSSASAARPGTPATRSTTSARSAASRRTRPTDNVSELTARVNDEGWDTCFSEWLKVSRLRKGDGVLVFSVGGGNREKNVSVNLVRSLELAREVGAPVFGIVGRDGGLHEAGRRRVRGHPDGVARSRSRPTPRGSARSSGTCW